jgi:ABC-type transport system involved in cytochrome c biogenesis permease subunit
MELILNLIGAFVAMALVGLWLRWAPRAGVDRRTQIVALALLILILFPVISVTDDLLAIQNPAETDTSLRRDHGFANPNSTFPAAAALPEPLLAELPFGFLRFVAPGALPAPMTASPALAPIENRPPPTA